MSGAQALFFSGWAPLLRVVVVGTLGYLFLLFTLRAAGPRALAKTNLFDFIILVTLGSAFGRALTAKDVALAEACVAFALLASLQYGASRLRLRSGRIAALLDAEPTLLYFAGRPLPSALRQARLTQADIETAVRAKGLGTLERVEAVILEPSGELSVIQRGQGPQELVAGVAGADGQTP
jgi:uncharacterized membrane protein YcaP (DUF421 family)